jgi:hypothetical protein
MPLSEIKRRTDVIRACGLAAGLLVCLLARPNSRRTAEIKGAGMRISQNPTLDT